MTSSRVREAEAAQIVDRRLLRPDELASLLGIPRADLSVAQPQRRTVRYSGRASRPLAH